MDAARRVFGAAALFGVAAAVILLSVGVALTGSSAGSPVVVLGAVIPLLVLQDSARAVSYARGDVGNALTSSSIWTFGTIVGVAALLLGGVFTIELILVVWGLTAGLAMIASAARIRLTPNVRGAVAWMRESRTIAGQSLTDFLLTQAVGHGGGLAIAAVAGSAAYGVLRVAQLPLALTQIVITGAIAFLTPTMVVRVARQNSTAARRLALVGAVAIGSVVTVNGLIVLLLPSEVMTWLLGDGWHASRSLVPIIAATLIASGIAASYGPYLRAVGALSAQVRLKVWTAPTALMLIALGSAVYGAIGGASAQFVSTAVVAGASVYLARFAWAPRAAKQ
jgi:O-antigen/teichoic acid export membrane protein